MQLKTYLFLLAVVGLLACNQSPQDSATAPTTSPSLNAEELEPESSQVTQQSGKRSPQPDSAEAETSNSMIAGASFDIDGAIEASLADFSVKGYSQDCTPLMGTLIECIGGVELEVIAPTIGAAQIFSLDEFYLNPHAALYRGPLDGTYRKDHVSIIVSDVNGDGVEDIAFQTGREGAYGSYSYDIYLRDEERNSYVLSRPFSDLTVGHLGMFASNDGKIIAYTKSGCCEHSVESYVVENNAPKLVEIVTETVTDDGAPPKRTEKRLINGKLQAVHE